MATTEVALALIGTTLVTIAVFCWALIYYIPLLLDGEEHESHADPGHPS